MTQRNSAAARVHFLVGNLQHVLAVDGHGGEGLVDLDDVDFVEGEVELCEELGDRDRGADAHYAGRDAGDGGAAEFGQDGLIQLEGFGALHEENCGGFFRDMSVYTVFSWGPESTATTYLHQ